MTEKIFIKNNVNQQCNFQRKYGAITLVAILIIGVAATALIYYGVHKNWSSGYFIASATIAPFVLGIACGSTRRFFIAWKAIRKTSTNIQGGKGETEVSNRNTSKSDSPLHTRVHLDPPFIRIQVLGELMGSFLSLGDLQNIAMVKKAAHTNAGRPTVEIARRYGYRGENSLEAKEHLKKLSHALHIFIKMSFFPREYRKYVVFSTKMNDPNGTKEYLKLKLMLRELEKDISSSTGIFVSKSDGRMCDISQAIDFEITFKNLKEAISKELNGKVKWKLNMVLGATVGKTNTMIVKLLLLFGLDSNLLFNRSLLLHRAAGRQCIADVDFLLEHKVEVNNLDSYGDTALFNAIKSSCGPYCDHSNCEPLIIVKRLLENGADPNLSEKAKPLHWAVGYSHYESIKLLLQYGADPNALTFEGSSVLQSAIYGLSNDLSLKKMIIKLLLEKGAVPDLNLDPRPLRGKEFRVLRAFIRKQYAELQNSAQAL